MYEPTEIKVNFGNFLPRTYCQACLSSDRVLTSVGEYIEVYHIIVDSSHTFANTQNTFLCWECMAILKKIQKFQVKAVNAHKLLTYHLLDSETTSLPSLSTLTTFFKDDAIFFDHDDEEPDIKEEILNLEPICDIKQENYELEQEIQIEYSGDETQDIEQDDQTIKKSHRGRVKKYRYVYNGNVRKKRLLRKKFQIKPNEVALWIEREINSDYYQKLTYKCKSCWYASNCRDKYRKHTVANHRKASGPYVCHICKCRFGTESDLNEHSPSHYTGRQCGVCGLQCYSARQLNAHLDTHRMVQCVECEALFRYFSKELIYFDLQCGA